MNICSGFFQDEDEEKEIPESEYKKALVDMIYTIDYAPHDPMYVKKIRKLADENRALVQTDDSMIQKRRLNLLNESVSPSKKQLLYCYLCKLEKSVTCFDYSFDSVHTCHSCRRGLKYNRHCSDVQRK
jgi:hypothetical protein